MTRSFLTALGLLVCCVLFSAQAWAQGYPSVSEPFSVERDGSRDVALVVAVEDYVFLPDVTGARETARDWVQLFRDGFNVGQVYDLVDQEVTRETLLRFARQAASEVGEGGTLWFVFVGHGAPSPDGSDGLIVGVDAQQNIDSLTARGLAQQELLRVLEGGSQAQTVAVVDACFSGRDGAGATLVPGLQPVVPVSSRATVAARTVVLSAAQSDQFAGALPGAERPAFSYFMLGALRGWAADQEAGELTAGQALEFTRRKLRAVTDRVQTPVGSGDLDLVLVSGAMEADPLPNWDGRRPIRARPNVVERRLEADAPLVRRSRRDHSPGTSLQAIPSSLTARQALFEEQQLISHEGTRYASPDLQFYQGSWGNPVEGADFYRLIGRDDLAAAYRPARNWMLCAGTAGGTVGGAAVGGLLGFGIGSLSTEPAVGYTVGFAALGGFVGLIGGLIWGAVKGAEYHPVEPDRRILLSEEYNENLRRELGLD